MFEVRTQLLNVGRLFLGGAALVAIFNGYSLVTSSPAFCNEIGTSSRSDPHMNIAQGVSQQSNGTAPDRTDQRLRVRLYQSFPMGRSNHSATSTKHFPPEPASSSPAAALKRARELNKTGEQPRAIDVLSQAMKVFPDSRELYVERAECCIHERRMNDALHDLDVALTKGAPDAVVYRIRAKTNFMLHDYASSLRDFEKAAGLGPPTADDYYMRASCCASLGDKKAVIENVAMVLKQDPKNAEAYYLRAQTYKSLNKNSLAAADFAKAMSLQK